MFSHVKSLYSPDCVIFYLCPDTPWFIICFLIFLYPPLTCFFVLSLIPPFYCSRRLMKGICIHKATKIKRSNLNTRPVQRDASAKQTAIKGPYGKSPGCTTSCGLRLPRKTEVTAAKLIKHLGCKFAKGLRLVVMRKKKRSPPSKVSSFSGRSQPPIIPINNDSHRSEAIEDCIQFINSSSSFTRSNSTS
ncbi:putative ubiquitinyl hydrolase 1 [Arabidopsis thaliana]